MIDYLREFNIITIIIRLVLACLCGSLLGLNREKQGRAAGLRTYYILCLGSCAVTLLGQYFDLMLNTQWLSVANSLELKTDVTRFAASVVNGIGFLGAGSILLTRKNQVRGLTSAASLWTTACLGITIGAGFVELGVIAFIFLWFVLKVLSFIESKAGTKQSKVRFGIVLDDISHIGKVVAFAKGEGLEGLEYDYSQDSMAYLELSAVFPRFYPTSDFIGNVYSLDCVKSIKRL